MTPKRKRQPKSRGNYRKVYPYLTMENYSYVSSMNVDASLADNINKIIDDHRYATQYNKAKPAPRTIN